MKLVATVIVIVLCVVVVGAAAAEEESQDARYSCGKPKGTFEVRFKEEVELRDLVAWAMGFSCKRFVYEGSVAKRSAKLTMITPGKLDAREAWGVFEVGLEVMGLTMVPKGNVLEIVESAQAKDEALAIRRTFPDGGGGVVRVLVRPQFVSVEELRTALELVRSKHGVVTALTGIGAVLVTDDARHAAQMARLVRDIDQPDEDAGVWAIPVKHRDATKLLDVLGPLVETATGDRGGGKNAKPATRLIADGRVNAVFVVGSAGEHARVAALVRALDVDQGDDVQMSAVRLRNARAAEVVGALQPLVGANAGATGAPTAAVSGPVKLSSDPGTNAVLVLASPRDTLAVRAMLAELDAPRRQVYVETMVLEVSSNASRDLGASWHVGKDTSGGGLALGGFAADGFSSVFPKESLASAGAGLVGGLFGVPLASTLLGESVPSLGALISAVATSGEVEVLASPHFTMLDNKPAKLSVGSNIPYISQTAGTSPLVPSGQQISRQPVALVLEITAHVAPADVGDGPGDERIHLDIKLDHDQLGLSDFEGLGPTWKERSLETSVVLRDQDTYVLGGLIDERVEHNVSKIPVLGDIPVLGALFRTTHTSREKANLLIIITPHLIDDSAAGRAVLDRRLRERDEFLRARSALSTRVAAPAVDYRRKRGLLAEIDATLRAVERERAALDAVRTPTRPSGRIDAPAPADTSANP